MRKVQKSCPKTHKNTENNTCWIFARIMYVCAPCTYAVCIKCIYVLDVCTICLYFMYVLYVEVPANPRPHTSPKGFESCFVRRCRRTAAVTWLLSAMTDCKLPDPVILTGSGSLHSVIGLRSKVTTVARQRRRLRIKRYFVGGDDHLMGSGCGR